MPKVKKAKNLKGFVLIENYITPKLESELIKKIDRMDWVVDYQRRLQYYNYRNELFEPYDLIPIPQQIPMFLEKVIDQLLADKIIETRPDQIIINEYEPGQGLRPHFDRKDYYQNVVIGLSLGSGIQMEFYLGSEKKSIYVPARSVYVIKDDTRYKWKHGIPSRKSDIVDGQIVPRQRRISITFRNVIPEKVKRQNIRYPERTPE